MYKVGDVVVVINVGEWGEYKVGDVGIISNFNNDDPLEEFTMKIATLTNSKKVRFFNGEWDSIPLEYLKLVENVVSE
jgi:hypothetical protein